MKGAINWVTLALCCLPIYATSIVYAADNEAVFEFSAESQWDVIFPNDLFTVAQAGGDCHLVNPVIRWIVNGAVSLGGRQEMVRIAYSAPTVRADTPISLACLV